MINITGIISFLGPKGTFSHEAATTRGDNLLACCTIPAVMESVASNQVSEGIVPIENSIEGPVGLTLDSIAHKYDLNIIDEIIIPIKQNLIVNKGTKMEDIIDVYSHSQAIAQCQDFINNNNLTPHYSISTANAAKNIIGDKTKAAIGNIKSAELYDLDIIRTNIQDRNNNETRFIVVSKQQSKPTGNDKTSIIFSIIEDQPGSLYEVLKIFVDNNINLTKIESRPSKEALGKYIFFVDFYGHRQESHVKNVLNQINDKSVLFKVLGSYPEFQIH